MIRWNTRMVHAFAASAIVASPVLAQKQDKAAASAATCSINTKKPDDLNSANNALTVAQLGGRPEDVQKKLRGAVTSLTGNPSKFKDNPAGHDYVLGQTLLRWAAQFPDSQTVNKGSIGYVEGKDQSVDLFAAADTLLSSVEKSNPDCAAEIQSTRTDAMRPIAIHLSALVNTDSLPAQEAALKRLTAIDSKSALSLYFQGMVAQNKKDPAAAADLFSRGAALMPAEIGADSNLKAALELGAAQMTRVAASGKTGEEKKSGMLKAAELYKKFLADFPKSQSASDAQSGLAAALTASGDAKSVSALWDQMLANPAGYSDAQLYDAGTQAFTMNQPAAATKLMDVAQKSNPWLRPGMYNAANVYWKAGDFDRMLAASRKLTAMDPNNPDEYQLLALAYQGKAKAARAAKDLKAEKAYNDSLNVAFAASENVKSKVTFEQFATGSGKPTLKGTIENIGTTPQKGTLKLQFVNLSGAPLSTQTVDFSLAPKAKMPFSLTGEGNGIVGYRYDPIP